MRIDDSFVALIEAMDETRASWANDFETQDRLRLNVLKNLNDFEAEHGRNPMTVDIRKWCGDPSIAAPLSGAWFRYLRAWHRPQKIDSYASTVVMCPEPTMADTYPIQF